MKQIEQPLYPKLSSIYNKIFQLLSAIVLIVVLMSFWVSSRDSQQESIYQHASDIGQMYLSQAAQSSLVHLQQGNKALQQYVDTLVQEPLIADVHVYDNTGLVIASSEQATTINALYGLSPLTMAKTNKIQAFIQEVRTDKLHGYIRLSLNRDILAQDLIVSNRTQYDMIKVIMLLAGVVGFLLTRGLNRFSRQGYRLPKVQ